MTDPAKYEKVQHPVHYNDGDIEHVEYVEDRGWAIGYLAGNATKYLHRAGLKPDADQLTDLKKAAWYLNRLVAWLEQGKAIWKIQRKPTTGSTPGGGEHDGQGDEG